MGDPLANIKPCVRAIRPYSLRVEPLTALGLGS